MTQTKIFVSSTFFDLAQVRGDIRVTINSVGHEALLSEYPLFPTLPTFDTIENCRQAVRSSDIFVLIVAGGEGYSLLCVGKRKRILNIKKKRRRGIIFLFFF